MARKNNNEEPADSLRLMGSAVRGPRTPNLFTTAVGRKAGQSHGKETELWRGCLDKKALSSQTHLPGSHQHEADCTKHEAIPQEASVCPG